MVSRDWYPRLMNDFHEAQFDASIYRQNSLDLQSLSDEELWAHFLQFPDEQRLFGRVGSTSEYVSMRWIRGKGVEVGSGNRPTRLFRGSSVVYVDCDASTVYGGETPSLEVSIESNDFERAIGQVDFVIASHVLEHAHSILRALRNLLAVTRSDGIVYLVLPDMRFLPDEVWMTSYDFEHHLREWDNPRVHVREHEKAFLASMNPAADDWGIHCDLTEQLKEALLSGTVPENLDYVYHKHTYSLDGWLRLLVNAQEFLGNTFTVEEIRFGTERFDWHFVLRKLAQV